MGGVQGLKELGFKKRTEGAERIWTSPTGHEFVLKYIDNRPEAYLELVPLKENTNSDFAISGHMAIDLLIDIMQDPHEVYVYYLESDKDLEKTLNKLQTFNSNWRFLVDHKGEDFAINLIKKCIKKFEEEDDSEINDDFLKYL